MNAWRILPSVTQSPRRVWTYQAPMSADVFLVILNIMEFVKVTHLLYELSNVFLWQDNNNTYTQQMILRETMTRIVSLSIGIACNATISLQKKYSILPWIYNVVFSPTPTKRSFSQFSKEMLTFINFKRNMICDGW